MSLVATIFPCSSYERLQERAVFIILHVIRGETDTIFAQFNCFFFGPVLHREK